MSTPEPEQSAAAVPAAAGSEKPRSNNLLIYISIVVVVIVMGIAVSIVIAVRGGEGPLVPAGDQGAPSATAAPELFEPEPFFDEQGNVVYIPRDNDNGVLLPQAAPSVGRSETTAPTGLMLQRVHENMYMPFSTSDGPTGFTDNGVAIGFSRTPQGAVLAAYHYSGYLATGNDRIALLEAAGRVTDPGNVIPKQKQVNAALDFARGAARDSSPYRVLPVSKVDFHTDLARVYIGGSLERNDGTILNLVSWWDLVWRDGTGWVVRFLEESIRAAGTVPEYSADDGWVTWW